MNEEHKTPEMREQMTDIERLRHSASHVLATAILKLWPEAQFAAGPSVAVSKFFVSLVSFVVNFTGFS